MNPVILYLFFWAVGGLSEINDSCSFVDDRSKEHTGLCRAKSECQRSGLAAVSSNAAGDKLCAGDDDSIRCCIDIKCGEHQCTNNVQGNSCSTGTFMSNSRNHIYCPSPSSDDNIQCCVENGKQHELRAVNDHESWGFDNFDPPDVTDTSGDFDSYLDDTTLLGDSDLTFDDPSSFQVAQVTGGINVDTPIDNSLDYQNWNMDRIPAVQNLQPKYPVDDTDDDQYIPEPTTIKTLKSGTNKASYLQIDKFNNKIAPKLRMSSESPDTNEWSPGFTDGRNDGPGISSGSLNLGWSSQYSGPQMIYEISH